MSDSVRRRAPWSRRIVKYVMVVVVAMAASVSIAALSSASSTPGTAVAGSAVPAAAVGHLQTIMQQQAANSGDPKPASITAVVTTYAQALEDATPGDQVPGAAGQSVYLVVMKGKFTLGNAPVPRGAKAPTGHYLAITLDPATFQILDLGLSDSAPPVALGHLGPVSDLTS